MQSLSELNLPTFISNEQTFMQGADASYFISNLVATILNLSVSLEAPLTKSCVLELCRFIELLKVNIFATSLTFKGFSLFVFKGNSNGVS